MASSSSPSDGPLAGVRILDLTQMLSGPFSTMVLADLGADVIKVEPVRGDATRSGGPYLPGDDTHAFGGYFSSINRNKRSIVVDLKHPDGPEVLKRMVATADVVVENFRVGVMDRLGVGFEALSAVNPRLVYASLRGFGDPRTGESPYATWPAYDVTAQAMGGLMGITGPDEDTPTKCGPGVGDIIPGLFLSVGVLAALRHAEATGQGQMVDVSMVDAVLAVCERMVYQFSYAGIVGRPQGNSHPLLCPFDAFPATDGAVTIAAPADSLWRELADAIGQPDLGTDPRYATNANRLKHGDQVRRLLSEWTSTRSKAEIVAVLGGRVPCAPVNTAADIFDDPHVAARHMIVPVELPGNGAPAQLCGVPTKFTRTPAEIRRRPPLLGEHTAEVLAEFGMNPADVERLRSGGAVL
jgi:crotonobetainyl-CoA:carnitine CoA-transferase CaiB-like acyl-CoA transferase